MSALGDHGVPKVDAVIFADPQDEPPWVYETVNYYREFAEAHGFVFVTVTKGSLSAALEKGTTDGSRYASIPAWTMGGDGRESKLRRQCTREYKIEPIWKEVRRLLGVAPRKRLKQRVDCLLGISLDEFDRMKESRIKQMRNCYYLIEADLTREHCEEYLRSKGLPVPLKSSCYYCPYHDDNYWIYVRDHHPELFARSVRIDHMIRNATKRGIRQPIFIHRSLVPLDEVVFSAGSGERQFVNECEGHCGI